MRVLIAFGTKRGGTAGLAEMLAAELRARNFDCEVRPAGDVRIVTGYDAVVVGGSLYAGRWHITARRLVRRSAAELRTKPVWLFSSGPLDESATEHPIAPVAQVAHAMEQSNARGHMTFGGRLEADAKGFPASAMAKKHAGDWRDRDQVAGWAKEIADELGRIPSDASMQSRNESASG